MRFVYVPVLVLTEGSETFPGPVQKQDSVLLTVYLPQK